MCLLKERDLDLSVEVLFKSLQVSREPRDLSYLEQTNQLDGHDGERAFIVTSVNFKLYTTKKVLT